MNFLNISKYKFDFQFIEEIIFRKINESDKQYIQYIKAFDVSEKISLDIKNNVKNEINQFQV